MNCRRPPPFICGFGGRLRKDALESIDCFRIVFGGALQGAEQFDITSSHKKRVVFTGLIR